MLQVTNARPAEEPHAELIHQAPAPHEPLVPFSMSPPPLTHAEAEELTEQRLRISRRTLAWVEAERELRGRPEDIGRRAAEIVREAAWCDVRAADIAAAENVKDAVGDAVYRWRIRAQYQELKGWDWAVSFEDFNKEFREGRYVPWTSLRSRLSCSFLFVSPLILVLTLRRSKPGRAEDGGGVGGLYGQASPRDQGPAVQGRQEVAAEAGARGVGGCPRTSPRVLPPSAGRVRGGEGRQCGEYALPLLFLFILALLHRAVESSLSRCSVSNVFSSGCARQDGEQQQGLRAGGLRMAPAEEKGGGRTGQGSPSPMKWLMRRGSEPGMGSVVLWMGSVLSVWMLCLLAVLE